MAPQLPFGVALTQCPPVAAWRSSPPALCADSGADPSGWNGGGATVTPRAHAPCRLPACSCCLFRYVQAVKHAAALMSHLPVPCHCSLLARCLFRYVQAVKHAADAAAREQLEKVVELLVTDRANTFEECVAWARKRFQDYFYNRIAQVSSRATWRVMRAHAACAPGQLFQAVRALPALRGPRCAARVDGSRSTSPHPPAAQPLVLTAWLLACLAALPRVRRSSPSRSPRTPPRRRARPSGRRPSASPGRWCLTPTTRGTAGSCR